METYFQSLTNGIIAVIGTAFLLLLAGCILGLIALGAIKAVKAIYVHATIAAQEPREAIVKKWEKRGKLVRFEEKKRRAA